MIHIKRLNEMASIQLSGNLAGQKFSTIKKYLEEHNYNAWKLHALPGYIRGFGDLIQRNRIGQYTMNTYREKKPSFAQIFARYDYENKNFCGFVRVLHSRDDNMEKLIDKVDDVQVYDISNHKLISVNADELNDYLAASEEIANGNVKSTLGGKPQINPCARRNYPYEWN